MKLTLFKGGSWFTPPTDIVNLNYAVILSYNQRIPRDRIRAAMYDNETWDFQTGFRIILQL